MNSVNSINITPAQLLQASKDGDAIQALRDTRDTAQTVLDTAQTAFNEAYPSLVSKAKGTRKPMSDETKAKMKEKAMARWDKVRSDKETLEKIQIKGKAKNSAIALPVAPVLA